jgi:hypothetical protein
MAQFGAMVVDGLRPRCPPHAILPPGTPNPAKALCLFIERMWHAKDTERPTITEVSEFLSEIKLK